ncbi:hypothetical protein FOL47_004478 [Perkinsus chesapeaki]|uniref:WW domain-containing protein n=1 Tax=Perkinsus chesapeaki TaxID=330153 RepID=A0A7J6M2K3_PERCH|nr:hypothetical protein FOL47_004478 [Perkinsus chesapeaki]
MSSDSLPSGWTRYTTDDGEEYFFNEITEVTQWDRPTQPATRASGGVGKKKNKKDKGEYVPIDAGALMDEGFEAADDNDTRGSMPPSQAPKRSTGAEDAPQSSSSSTGSWLWSKLTCGLTLSYIQDNFFDVTSRDVQGRLFLAMWPYRLSLLSPSSSLHLPSPGGSSQTGGRIAQFFGSHFADSIQLLSSYRSNPDLWGPFWICTTAVIFLTATANFSRQLLGGNEEKGHITDYTLAGTAWFVLFGVMILGPLITLGLLVWATNQSGNSESEESGWWTNLPAWLQPGTGRHNTYVIDDSTTNTIDNYAVPPAHGQTGGGKTSLWLLLTSAYGYSMSVMLPMSILWIVPIGWVKTLTCALGFLTAMVFLYITLLRTGGVDGTASGDSPILQRLGVTTSNAKTRVQVALITALVAVVMEGGIWASCRFSEIPLPGGIYYDKEKGEYRNKFTNEKAVFDSLLSLLTKSPHNFFERYQRLITTQPKLLAYFADLAANGDPEVQAFVQGASRATKCYKIDGQPADVTKNCKVVGHRRVLWIQREEGKSNGYFSEAQMRRRDAGLWHSLVGKYEKGGGAKQQQLIDAVNDDEYDKADENGKREIRKAYIVDQMEAHLHDGSAPHYNPRLEPLSDEFITEAIDLADFDAEAADCREERVQALRKTMEARFLDGRDGRFIDYTEIDDDEELEAFISREAELVTYNASNRFLYRRFITRTTGEEDGCMNTPRGTVEGCIEGPAKIVDEMVYWLGNVGSKRARIDRLEVKDRNEISVDDRQFTSFVVRQ